MPIRATGKTVSLLVAISGATASGKSTFAEQLCGRLEDLAPVLLKQDHYFRDFLEVPESEREAAVTSNHPRAVLWDELVRHLDVLKSGGQVRVPVEGTRFRRRQEPNEVGPSRVVVVEGHLLFTDERVVSLADLKVFMDANVHERVVRRLLRDTKSGDTSLEKATAWYRRDVIPNVSVYSEPYAGIADIVVPFERDSRTAVDAVAAWVRANV